MKIGVWLNEAIVPTIGGASSYTSRLTYLIDHYDFSEDVEICFVSIGSCKGYNKRIIDISQIPVIIYKLFSLSDVMTRILKKIDRRIILMRGLRKVLKGTDIKIMYYLQQQTSMDYSFPSIYTNWDIGHRSTYAFPELIVDKEFETRDHYYQIELHKALLVVCESETGKNELIRYTNLGQHKIRVMPMFAGGVSKTQVSEVEMNEILSQYGLEKNRYFYYPAQLWPHKNHIGLMRAFKEFLIKHDDNYRLVLSGSDKGNGSYIKKVSEELGLGSKILFLGFLPEVNVYTLYCNATCLVMASHFGPTNMPPIEAMEVGCPVACTDLGGHREILGDSAVYFDSFDDHSICNAMIKIVENREEYVKKINDQGKRSKFNSKYAMQCLDQIFHDAKIIRSNWE